MIIYRLAILIKAHGKYIAIDSGNLLFCSKIVAKVCDIKSDSICLSRNYFTDYLMMEKSDGQKIRLPMIFGDYKSDTLVIELKNAIS